MSIVMIGGHNRRIDWYQQLCKKYLAEHIYTYVCKAQRADKKARAMVAF